MAVMDNFMKPQTNNYERPMAVKIEEEADSSRYAKFITEPWEGGFGLTIGNSLRRVLLSMMPAVAVTAVRISDGDHDIPHEFTPVKGVEEDVMNIILNIKKLKLRCEFSSLPRTLELVATKQGVVTAGDIREDGIVEVLNKDLKICTLSEDKEKSPLRIMMELGCGRGYRPSEQNQKQDMAIGYIPIDSLFCPVENVRFAVRPARVGESTSYDRLELEVWTDARISPKDAVKNAAEILRDQLMVFAGEENVAGEAVPVVDLDDEQRQLLEKLCMNVGDMGLSVRSLNCINGENIHYVGELVQRSESQMLKCRNLGKKSLSEIIEKLEEMGLSLEMKLEKNVIEELQRRIAPQLQVSKEQA